MSYALGIDVGGTFTDAVASDGAGRIVSAKTPTTPPHREAGVMRAIEEIADELGIGIGELLSGTDYIAHGTTAPVNALVQGTVADVGLIATKGHRDSIYIMNAEGRTLGRAAHEIQDTLRPRKQAEGNLHRLAVEWLTPDQLGSHPRTGKTVPVVDDRHCS